MGTLDLTNALILNADAFLAHALNFNDKDGYPLERIYLRSHQYQEVVETETDDNYELVRKYLHLVEIFSDGEEIALEVQVGGEMKPRKVITGRSD